jgi:EAL domain-containing protein (putative c-di-GMP-specific phosphodiesterase class I)/CHASE2 domain-containing sensor protein
LKHYRPHILVLVALAIVLASGWRGTFRNALVDLRFALHQRHASGEIVVIAIDAPSIDKIGVWPWPRRLHAELLRRLEKAGVHDIVFDVDFSTPSDPASDEQFVAALQAAGGSVVLPWFKQPGGDPNNPGAVHINRPLPQFADHSWAAVVNVSVEPDGLVRRYSFGEKLAGEFVPSMGAMLSCQFAERNAQFLIDFDISAASIPRVSYVDVLRGDPATLRRLRDKKVVIGGTALELGDRFSIPNGGIVSGPVLQTLAAESILQKRTLHWSSDWITLVGLCLISLTMMLSWRRVSASGRVATLAAMAVGAETAAILLQTNFPLIIDTSLFQTAIAAYLAAIALDEIDFRDLLGRIAESRFQRIAMSLGDGLVCTDQDHLITVWNPGAAAIFGYTREEIVGQPFDTICAGYGENAQAFSICNSVRPALLLPGGSVMSVAQILDVTRLTPSLLELEVPEEILLQDEERVLDTFRRIQELGVRVVFDDFGTGYASLSYLKKFPLDGLKIDRSFVGDLFADSSDAAIVSSTIGLSKQLGLSVIAEGIENRASADLLVSMGCEEGQGYLFGRPMPVQDFESQFLSRLEDKADAGKAA